MPGPRCPGRPPLYNGGHGAAGTGGHGRAGAANGQTCDGKGPLRRPGAFPPEGRTDASTDRRDQPELDPRRHRRHERGGGAAPPAGRTGHRMRDHGGRSTGGGDPDGRGERGPAPVRLRARAQRRCERLRHRLLQRPRSPRRPGGRTGAGVRDRGERDGHRPHPGRSLRGDLHPAAVDPASPAPGARDGNREPSRGRPRRRTRGDRARRRRWGLRAHGRRRPAPSRRARSGRGDPRLHRHGPLPGAPRVLARAPDRRADPSRRRPRARVVAA